MSNKSFLIFALGFLSSSFGVATLSPLVPAMAETFGVDKLYMSHVSWYYMLPYGFFALVWAPLTRVVDIKKIFSLSALGFTLASLVFSFSATVGWAFAAEFCVGGFACAFMPLSLIVIGKAVAKENKGRYIGWLLGLSYVSSLCGVSLSGFLSWRQVYLISAGLGFITFVFSLLFLEKFDFRQESFKISYQETLRDKQAVALLVFIFLASFFYHSLQQLLGVYLNETYSLPQASLSGIFAVSTICSIILQFSGGILTRRFANTQMARAGFFLMSAFAGLLLLAGDWRWMFLLMILWGSGWALNHIGLSAYLTHLPDKVMRDASSLNSAIRFSSGGLGVMSANAIISWLGFKTQFAVVAVSAAVLGLFVHKVLSEHKEQAVS